MHFNSLPYRRRITDKGVLSDIKKFEEKREKQNQLEFVLSMVRHKQAYLVDRDVNDLELLLHLFPNDILAWRYSSTTGIHLIVTNSDLQRELSDEKWYRNCLLRNWFALADTKICYYGIETHNKTEWLPLHPIRNIILGKFWSRVKNGE